MEHNTKMINPFEEETLDNRFDDWSKLYLEPYKKETIEPDSKLRILLAEALEQAAIVFSHSLNRYIIDNDIRRELAMARRIEQQQHKRLMSLKPLGESILERAVALEQLSIELTANLAQTETNKYIRSALDFSLAEDFDHLYRLAGLLEMEKGIDGEQIVKGYTEIMPGRPTISSHRHPFDDVKRSTRIKDTSLQSKMNLQLVLAAEQYDMNFYASVGGFCSSDLARKLFMEIGMVEEQHTTQYGCLLDSEATALEKLLLHEFSECYAYYSFYEEENNKQLKKIWEYHLQQEISHLHKARKLLNKYEGKDYDEVVGEGKFMARLSFSRSLDRNREYIRYMLKKMADTTAILEDYVEVKNLPKDYQFFQYNRAVNTPQENVPSHKVIDNYIAEFGEDYRIEDSLHPIQALRDRKKDNTNYGR